MPKIPYLVSNGKGYSLQKRVPADLRSEYPTSMIKRYLGATFDVARRALPAAMTKLEEEFARKRLLKAAPTVQELADADIKRIADLYYAALLEEDEEVRLDGFYDPSGPLPAFPTPTFDEHAEELSENDAAARHDYARGNTAAFFMGEAEEVLGWEKVNVRLAPNSPSLRKLARELLAATLKANKAKMARNAGEVVETPAEPAGPLPVSPIRPPQGVTLDALITEYMNDPQRDVSQKTRDGYVIIFRVLKELLGEDKPVRTISRDDCKAVRDVLMKLPPNYTKRLPGLSAKEAAEVASAKGWPALTKASADSYLQNLSALFKWAVQEDRMDRNPAEGLAVAGKKVRGKDKRHPFTTDQLKAIFHAPLYTGCQDDERGYATPGISRPRRGRFWVPLLALWTGMRLNECCQLLVSDVRKEDGVWCIIISEDAEPGADPGDLKRVKTEAGERYVPVHPELEKIGFLQYVETMRATGETRLFPDLEAGANGYYSDPFSKWFNGKGRFLDKLGVKQRKISFHSLRHCYRDALREAELSRDAVLQLGGWSSGATDDDYGKGLRASTLFRAVSKVSYAELDLSHLYAAVFEDQPV